MQITSAFLSSLPENPGVYQFFDNTEKIIYIGKAKNLRKRVSSYFNRSSNNSAKIRALVSKIAELKYIVVNTESDALILENILIKKHQPRYNILLRDDKTYPWIVLRNEPFPRVETTRKYFNDGSIYYGPYTSGRLLKALIGLIRQLYPLRTCDFVLSESNISSGKFKPCLEYQIGNCLAPCIGLQSSKEYDENIKAIREILEGNINNLINILSKEMKNAALKLKFEKAHALKEKIKVLSNFQSKSSVITTTVKNLDVFTILKINYIVVVNYIKVNSGIVIQSYNLQIKLPLDNESLEDIFSQAILEIKNRLNISSKIAIINLKPSFPIEGMRFEKPKRGEKLSLVKLSIRNAEAYIKEIERNLEKVYPQNRFLKYLEKLKMDLNLPNLPEVIECFDNSNLQGTNPVAACVVFINGKPAKSEYRHFNIKTVLGPNDYASMREIVFRRYKRLLDENKQLPNLIIIDGGKGQLSAAFEVLNELKIQYIPIIGIAKRLEEIYRPGDSAPLYLDKRSLSLTLIQQLRDEAHRFGITFHRKKRQNLLESSILETIPGVGPKTVEKLYKNFKSIEKIQNASFEELSKWIPKKTAEAIFQFFQNNQ